MNQDNKTFYAVKLNNRIVSRPINSLILAEQYIASNLSEIEQSDAYVVQVDSSGREILMG